MKRVVILGSTGSIGRQAIDVVRAYRDRFQVVGLAARANAALLIEQARELRVKNVVLGDTQAAAEVAQALGPGCEVGEGPGNLPHLAVIPPADVVLNALVGSVGLRATLAAIDAGKTVLLANKESLVAGGELVTKTIGSRDQSVLENIVPVDSEHNAVFQLIAGETIDTVEEIILTGSGGPFRGRRAEELAQVSIEEALAHPRWSMGLKISIDSATLMNKGLEVIEAHYLFGANYSKIKVAIHPQSIVHSMVRLTDGAIKAHLGPTDMKHPIRHALFHPARAHLPKEGLDPVTLEDLRFEPPDTKNFPCLKMAVEAGRLGRTYPAVLNKANEAAVAGFLAGRIGFTGISKVVQSVLDAHEGGPADTLAAIEEAEGWAEQTAETLIREGGV